MEEIAKEKEVAVRFGFYFLIFPCFSLGDSDNEFVYIYRGLDLS